MNTLKFNKKYYEAIASGKKTQTMRNKNKRLRVDETIRAVFPGTDKELTIRITNTGYKQFKYLNDEDAELEGFDNLEELKNDLLDIYPLMDFMTRLWWYQFELIK